jgi:hypothetical protein
MNAVAGVPRALLTAIGWTWQPLVPGGVLHLLPPRRLSGSTTACWRPLQGAASPQLALAIPDERSSGRHCQACLAHNGGEA